MAMRLPGCGTCGRIPDHLSWANANPGLYHSIDQVAASLDLPGLQGCGTERKKASVAVRKIENKIRRGSERRSNDVRRSESWKKSPLAHPPNPASKEKARLKNKNKGGAKSQGSSSTPQTPQSSKTIIQSQAFGRS
ncbi:unnamed protein product [Allacma fusca]|uniref:Uncharacterized protein n=1 Tax=Allacma fusca TaxID=39272 RepID=A0A8J2JIS7_9HEXA|nr:unnamed protein product [Allacma fusca]